MENLYYSLWVSGIWLVIVILMVGQSQNRGEPFEKQFTFFVTVTPMVVVMVIEYFIVACFRYFL